jgi:transcriptional regulator with GAF, ATPase, and Fis domain
MSSTAQTLSLERKIKMHEAREAIIDRLAPDLNSEIDVDRYLRAIVAELGRMMEVDRCDLIQLGFDSELRISHEWRASEKLASSLGLTLPVDISQLRSSLDLSKPIRLDDINAHGIDEKVRLFAESLGTRSLLVIPIVLGSRVVGLMGLHDTSSPRVWLDDEISFLQSIARQIAVGYQYTIIYTDKQREAERTKALLEIANALNARSDFSEVTSVVLERAIALLDADYGALGVIDPSSLRISLAAFKAAPHASIEGVRGLIDAHGKSLDIKEYPAMIDLIKEGNTLQVMDSSLPLPLRLIFNSVLGGRAALIAPVRIGEQIFGLLGLVWSGNRGNFAEHEIALIKGIADQIGTALERDHLTAELMRLRTQLVERLAEQKIIGQAPAIRRAIELALNVADTQTSVLILGESGTGKELFANLIHYNSRRKDKPFIKLNCGAIPETLLESELFGHEKGAFTDARSRRRGRFEEADGGTLFLDEIGEMSLSAQVRLLRVLQDGEFTRVGGNEVLKTDVRVIAASNVDLERAVEQGSFRRDLYYRLSVFPINLPPLRERPGDIHPLVIHFIEHYKQKTGRFISGITKEAIQALVNYEWPGNVRELENALERAVIIASGRTIGISDLPEAVSSTVIEERTRTRSERATAAREGRAIRLELDVPLSMDEVEKMVIEATLDYTSGDKTHAARVLEIGRKTLYRKLQRYSESDKET